ncbi:type II toxin-antitoxin system MqsA family antitoxin [Leptolyngbya sp. AN03gr2]|uniref:type II toxin-antitoxin system MqsA family antitoxin n=1 Tax=unclassified Leptolyngbya TaxID=2650499 RepID=UPI003D316EEA
MICDVCGQGNARIRYLSRSYGKDERLLVIRNVPVVNCPDCGETYLTAQTLHQIQQKQQERKTVIEAALALDEFERDEAWEQGTITDWSV